MFVYEMLALVTGLRECSLTFYEATVTLLSLERKTTTALSLLFTYYSSSQAVVGGTESSLKFCLSCLEKVVAKSSKSSETDIRSPQGCMST